MQKPHGVVDPTNSVTGGIRFRLSAVVRDCLASGTDSSSFLLTFDFNLRPWSRYILVLGCWPNVVCCSKAVFGSEKYPWNLAIWKESWWRPNMQ